LRLLGYAVLRSGYDLVNFAAAWLSLYALDERYCHLFEHGHGG
jgi:hypothetical protein